MASPPQPRGTYVPSPVLVVLAVVPLGLAIASVFDPSLVQVMLLTDAALVAIAVIDALLVRRCTIRIKRDTQRVFSIGRKNAVTLRIKSTAKRALKVRVQDDVFDSATSEGLPATVSLPAQGRTRIQYTVTPTERGSHALADHYVRFPSLLGLWIRQFKIPARSELEVYPDVALVRTFERLSGQARGSTMVQAHPRRGGESEFEQLRDYIPGDAYKRVDWKATARRGKLISREYQLERDQNLLLAIDTGRLMTAETDGIALFDHSLNATLMLAHIAAKGGDRVGLLTFDHEVRTYVPPTAGGAMQHIIRASYAVHPRLVATDFERGVSWVSTRVRKRALVVLFTQVNDHNSAAELVRMVRQLSGRHLPVVVLFRDEEIDEIAEARGEGAPADDYAAAAAAELLGWRDTVLRSLRAAGVLVLDVRPGELTTRLVNTYLDVKSRHLL